ncbi:hypothetical protein N657DRAFT_300053 [Parathielavia appendiculata]|uniref:Uncharacterized protein n=1 Tax=Parathielavia appendiculata TaxID=2587402 RepID=A0AAN6U5A5_9PEZI|nr:hypothetical protein N657DRAFT_300053 [Parathielavia appendiculata]
MERAKQQAGISKHVYLTLALSQPEQHLHSSPSSPSPPSRRLHLSVDAATGTKSSPDLRRIRVGNMIAMLGLQDRNYWGSLYEAR